MHIPKYYQPAVTGERVSVERRNRLTQAAPPEVEHDLLVTATHAPAVSPPGCATLQRVFYLSGRPRHGGAGGASRRWNMNARLIPHPQT